MAFHPTPEQHWQVFLDTLEIELAVLWVYVAFVKHPFRKLLRATIGISLFLPMLDFGQKISRDALIGEAQKARAEKWTRWEREITAKMIIRYRRSGMIA